MREMLFVGNIVRLALCEARARTAHQVCRQHTRRGTMSSFKIYTKTGDTGTSSLYNGERRHKADAVFEALGDTDELNSAVGVAREACEVLKDGMGDDVPDLLRDLTDQLQTIQSRLLDVGSAVATPVDKSSKTKVERAAFAEAEASTADLERWIDALDAVLPPLKNFILPSGGQAASFLHLARTTCRRAERRIAVLVQDDQVDADVGKYMNRLSDYFFNAARFAAQSAGKAEVTYKKA